MSMAFRHRFTVNGHPFHVRHDRIVSIAAMDNYEQSDLNPQSGQPYKQGEQDLITGVRWLMDAEPTTVTVVHIDGAGSVIVEEDLDEALSIWDSVSR